MNAIENKDTINLLHRAVITENSEVINLKQAEREVTEILNSAKGIFSLSPTKILIVLDSVDNAVNAASSNSVLWSVFDDVRLWSEGENFDDRLVWLECFGIHPSCWTMDNVRKIGEKWGPVLTIENKIDDVCSLTYARMLVRTKAQNKIDARIRFQYEHGSCDVWIKESMGYMKKQNKTELVDSLTVDVALELQNEPCSEPCKVGHSNTVNTPFVDPILIELMNISVGEKDYEWVDPIVRNETAGWIIVQYVAQQRHYPQPQMIMTDSGNNNIGFNPPKTPRGRSRKNRNPPYPPYQTVI